MPGSDQDSRTSRRARLPRDTTEQLLSSTGRRLAATLLGLLLVLLAAVGLTTGLLATRSLDSSVDRSLETAAAAALSRLGESSSGGSAGQGSGGGLGSSDDEGSGASASTAPETSDSDDHPPAAADTFFLYLDAAGAVVSNPQRVALAGVPDGKAATAAIAAGRDLRTIEAGGTRVRLLTLSVRSEEGTAAGQIRTLQVGFVLTLHDEQTNDLLLAVLLVGIAGLLGAAAVTLVVTGRALRPIRSAFERERRFVAAASHELRTPAALIRGTAEVLAREGHVDPAGQPFVADIVAEADRLGALVTELSELALAQARPIVSTRLVDLVEVATDVVHRAAPMATGAGVRLIMRPATSPAPVRADRDRVVQVAMILIDNAVRHTPPGRLVTVSAESHGSFGVLSVQDEGAGIPLPDRERVFEPFAQLQPARATATGSPSGSSTGSGLGLAIARAIVDRMGGSIRLDDAPGGGSTFTVSLPAH